MHEEIITPYLIGLFAVFCVLLGILFAVYVFSLIRKRSVENNEILSYDYNRTPDKRYLTSISYLKSENSLKDLSKQSRAYKSDYINVNYIEHMNRINREIESK